MKQTILNRHFSVRIIGVVFFAVLALGLAAAPAGLWAQQTAPASGATSAAPTMQSANPDTSKPESTKAEESQEDAYLHAPMVQTFAKMLHLKLETGAALFEGINFLILVLAIGIPLVRVFPKIIRKRSQTLSHDIESARKMTEDAKTRLSAVEARLSKLDDEIAAIRAQVEEESKNDEVRIKSTIQEEKGRIVAAAEQEIGVVAAQAKRGLRNFAADLAIDQAAKQLVLTAENDRALIAEFVRDTATSGAGRGGQN